MGASRGIFFLVAGPSGAGKTTLLRRLLESERGLEKDISVTTRAPRPGEQDGRDYRFWDRARFEKGVAEGAFLEHAVVFGKDFYGTLASQVNERLERGIDVIKDMDVQGVGQVRARWPWPASVAIFVTPPTPEQLERRLRDRKTESEERVARRLATAREEIRRVGEYDYVVCNESVDDAVADLAAIRRAERQRRERLERAFGEAWKA
ncbi:MAG: guanylate kinase [Planctomycetota bacterium]|nr:guanylate kinase [Planctomycetota bacterium]